MATTITARAGVLRGKLCFTRKTVSPVRVVEGSILIEPSRMEMGRFYLAELDGKPFLYRKVSEQEIEVYGVAE